MVTSKKKLVITSTEDTKMGSVDTKFLWGCMLVTATSFLGAIKSHSSNKRSLRSYLTLATKVYWVLTICQLCYKCFIHITSPWCGSYSIFDSSGNQHRNNLSAIIIFK